MRFSVHSHLPPLWKIAPAKFPGISPAKGSQSASGGSFAYEPLFVAPAVHTAAQTSTPLWMSHWPGHPDHLCVMGSTQTKSDHCPKGRLPLHVLCFYSTFLLRSWPFHQLLSEKRHWAKPTSMVILIFLKTLIKHLDSEYEQGLGVHKGKIQAKQRGIIAELLSPEMQEAPVFPDAIFKK